MASLRTGSDRVTETVLHFYRARENITTSRGRFMFVFRFHRRVDYLESAWRSHRDFRRRAGGRVVETWRRGRDRLRVRPRRRNGFSQERPPPLPPPAVLCRRRPGPNAINRKTRRAAVLRFFYFLVRTCTCAIIIIVIIVIYTCAARITRCRTSTVFRNYRGALDVTPLECDTLNAERVSVDHRAAHYNVIRCIRSLSMRVLVGLHVITNTHTRARAYSGPTM